MNNSLVVVSVIMPIYNESKYINTCVESLLLQDYPKEKMEWIFVDGNSSDDTIDKLREYQKVYPKLIIIKNNPNKIVPYAMNIGIKESCGKYIVRMDAHADYKTDYISKCVSLLDSGDMDNVGGVAETKAKGFVGNAIAKMLSSRFGVGNSEFRVNGKSGYVDTVPFGAFRREVFSKYGGYDERLVRNQDNEMNYRIRKNGGKIFLSDEIHLSYYCRDSIKGIAQMAIKNGQWNVITMKLCPGSMGLRHFVPMAFVLSLLFFIIMGIFWNVFLWALMAEVLLYLVIDVIFSINQSNKVLEAMLLILLHPLFHVSYGFGSMSGLIKLVKKEYRGNSYSAPRL
ncbi:MAG: glycosyltransferase family 2 protein [Erysipelotrichaceae bacterium]|nr:glycosyltransferase family 2 protein [Erysipelotrichaceae bacterium]